MPLGIDHLVIAAPDPDAAATELERRLGLRAAGGGRHEALGTFNRLVWLGDSYLEFIGVFDEALAARSWLGPAVLAALARGGGLATWAVATDSLDELVAGWRRSGLAGGNPLDGERRRPDGRLVRWRLAIAGPLGPAEPPFLIEHDTTAAEWTAEERRQRAAETHPLGGPVRLAGLDLALAGPAAYVRRLEATLGRAAIPTDGGFDLVLGSQRVRLAAVGQGATGEPGQPVVRLTVAARVPPRIEVALGCQFIVQAAP